MASIFGHAAGVIAIGKGFSKELRSPKFWLLGILCSILPDADVIAFKFNIPYNSFWGHRGFSHSIVFALLLGIVLTVIFYRKHLFSKQGVLYATYFSLCTISHGVLDGLTNGGLGVAFFAPFDNTRYFFPWRPIQVSPIGASKFFSEWGLKVIISELFWIGIPVLLILSLVFLVKKLKK